MGTMRSTSPGLLAACAALAGCATAPPPAPPRGKEAPVEGALAEETMEVERDGAVPERAREPIEEVNVRVVRKAVAGKPGGHYAANRAPLAPTMFVNLPVGAIEPGGWLRRQLELLAEGLTGRLERISPHLRGRTGWTALEERGGWEEQTYWLKGFGDLGYVLGDERIAARAKEYVRAMMATQREDGWFGPENCRTSLDGKPDVWAHSPGLRAVRSYHEFTGDERAIDFMTRFLKWMHAQPRGSYVGGWGFFRFGDYLDSIHWLYNRTGDAWLLELATTIHETSADYTRNIPTWHNVNFAQGFREPAQYWQQSREAKHFEGAVWSYDRMMRLYGQFSGGGFAGDENCRPGFRDPRQAFEACGMVEFMASHEIMTRISGDPLWADRCEEVAFNSLPAAYTPDLRALRYLTAPNLVQADRVDKSPSIQNGGHMFVYSPYESNRCCLHNTGQGWPYFAENLWLATADGGLCASLYAASRVKAKVGDGTEIAIGERTDYPFGEAVAFEVASPGPVSFPLWLRVPGWCDAAEVSINGRAVAVEAGPRSYVVIEREWRDGDEVTLRLPMEVRVRRWTMNRNAVSVDCGPLTFSLAIGEEWRPYTDARWRDLGGNEEAWRSYEVFPTMPWNYGLELDPAAPADGFEVVRRDGPVPAQPWTREGVPVELRAKARRIPAWRMDERNVVEPLGESPAFTAEPVETVRLIPMGAARLRVSTFPTVTADREAGYDWAKDERPVAASASHCWRGDTVTALDDGFEIESSIDHSIPRFTWWDRRGTEEWVQYVFARPRKVSAAEVYWFDDTGRGACRVPESWRLLYRTAGRAGADADPDAGDWRPVRNPSGFGTERDRFNRVEFEPVEAEGLRIEVKLRPGVSGGILEWTVAE